MRSFPNNRRFCASWLKTSSYRCLICSFTVVALKNTHCPYRSIDSILQFSDGHVRNEMRIEVVKKVTSSLTRPDVKVLSVDYLDNISSSKIQIDDESSYANRFIGHRSWKFLRSGRFSVVLNLLKAWTGVR
mmetsp:Transcript_20930/g.43070  ORF Transcript_20930/g.43070 Transcript_20930/m.43070 type:complete len:131 (+) Transcript_20930:2135-2527(+)